MPRRKVQQARGPSNKLSVLSDEILSLAKHVRETAREVKEAEGRDRHEPRHYQP